MRKKGIAEDIKKEIVNIRKDDKQAKVLVVLTSCLFAAISTLFYILDWTLEWGLIKIVSCILVDIWLFFLPPAIRLSYLKNEGKTPEQWFMMGYRAGASGLWMPVLLAPLFGILYFLPRTYQKKGGENAEETSDASDAEKPEQKEAATQSGAVPEEKITPANRVSVAAETDKPKAEIPATVVPKEEKTPSSQPEIKAEPAAAKPTESEVKAETVAAPQVTSEVKVVPVPDSQEKIEVKAKPVAPLPVQPESIAAETAKD